MARTWYYQLNGQPVGPVEEGELIALCKAGTVNAATMVWRPGFSNWMPITDSDFDHKTLLSSPPAAPPPITQPPPPAQAYAPAPQQVASKADTFKFSTIIFIILGLLIPLWPISLPLFWFLAYRSYKAA